MYRARVNKKWVPPPPGPEAPTDAEVDNKVVEAALGNAAVPAQALQKAAVADASQLMTAGAPPVVHRPIAEVVEQDYEFKTDLMAAARYMPQFRRAARALVRYREKLNDARQKVLQVPTGCAAPGALASIHPCMLSCLNSFFFYSLNSRLHGFPRVLTHFIVYHSSCAASHCHATMTTLCRD